MGISQPVGIAVRQYKIRMCHGVVIGRDDDSRFKGGMIVIDFKELQPYLDEQGRVTRWPSKRNRARVQTLVLWYLASKFSTGVAYTEREVNSLLNQHHTFQDPALLRRELYEHGLIQRKRDGSAYWLPPEMPIAESG